MRDGTRIAVDLYLPPDLAPGERVPTILHQTRYFRSVALRPGVEHTPLRKLFDMHESTRPRFLEQGYAWMDVCVRGSGASTGTRPHPWSPDEVADGAEIVDWIVRQPFSDGQVGAMGVSYSGTTAEMLLSTGHPAVKAVIPRFSLFDVYTDIAFPGGVHFAWFTKWWGRFNAMLDADDIAGAFALMVRFSTKGWRELDDRPIRRLLGIGDVPLTDGLARLFASALVAGVSPVDGDRRRALLRAAMAEHAGNYDVHEGALKATFRDDHALSEGLPDGIMDDFSPHARAAALRATGVPVYSYSGWLDGAYQHAAIKRFGALGNPGSRLILGPWEHGGGQDISPYNRRIETDFDHDGELLAFFEHHLRGRPSERTTGDPVRYYTIGAERWRSASTWPPPGVRQRTFFLAGGGCLTTRGSGPDASDPYAVDEELGSGWRSRWNCVLGTMAPVGYGDCRATDERLLCYTSRPLPEDLEVTGHPIIRLWVSSSATDGAFFVYLRDVAPSGRSTYVTEGILRALHRRESARKPPYPQAGPYHSFLRADSAPLVPGEPAELAFDLLPVSYRFRRGHALRIAIGGADRDHFATVTPDPPQIRVHRGENRPSCLVLPVMER